MTDEEQFSSWWSDVGQRVRAFDARSWALSGWLGHKMHGGEAPIEEEQKPSPICYLCNVATDSDGWCPKCKMKSVLDGELSFPLHSSQEPKQIEET